MKKLKALCALLICASMILLSSCKNIGVFSASGNELKIGVSGIAGVLNPFYAESEADISIISQMFSPIQRTDKDNSFVNHAGGISYEFVEGNKVKYIVSIRNDMFFSDGTNIKIDDVIFFYHIIADASYDGLYKNWYLNDIQGVKEYYYDDANYKDSVAEIKNKVAEKYAPSEITADDLATYLTATHIEGKFSGNIDDIRSNGESWKAAIDKSKFASQLKSLGEDADAEKILELVAKFEAETNSQAYDASDWFEEKLLKEYIDKSYSNGTEIDSISGIKKINDYTCTVLFNSKNINAVSQLNALLVPKSFFSAEYVKGSADKIKDIKTVPVSSGPYSFVEHDDSEVSLTANDFYFDFESDFKRVKFIDLAAEKMDPVKAVSNGKVDIVTVQAEQTVITSIADKPVTYQIDDCGYYTSLFFNTRSIESSLARKALMGLCNVNEVAENRIGAYYTRLYRPLSIRFDEYSESYDSPFYNDSAYTALISYTDVKLDKITAYYDGDEADIQYAVLEKFKDNLASYNINLEIVLTNTLSLESAVLSGEADIWISDVYDGATCDKYDYFHSNGSMNLTGLKNQSVNDLCVKIRSAVGFIDKAKLTDELLTLIMEQAVEYPLYQRQTFTLYNTETINSDSLKDINQFGSYTYLLPYLKSV